MGAALLGLAIHAADRWLDADLFGLAADLLKRMASWGGAGAALLAAGVMIDLFAFRRSRAVAAEIARQRLRVLKATMRTVNDIFCNFLNHLTLFQLQAEQSGALPSESLLDIEVKVQQTAARLREIAELEDTPELVLSDDIVLLDVGSANPSAPCAGSGS